MVGKCAARGASGAGPFVSGGTRGGDTRVAWRGANGWLVAGGTFLDFAAGVSRITGNGKRKTASERFSHAGRSSLACRWDGERPIN